MRVGHGSRNRFAQAGIDMQLSIVGCVRLWAEGDGRAWDGCLGAGDGAEQVEPNIWLTSGKHFELLVPVEAVQSED